MAERVMAKVKWFDNKAGWGFLVNPLGANTPDVFVHYKSIVGEGFKTLNEGDMVTFELEKGEKGPRAINVKRER